MKTPTLREAAAALGAVAIRKMEEESGQLSPEARTAAEKLAAVNQPKPDMLEKPVVDDGGPPLLIEGTLEGRELTIGMPNGRSAIFYVAGDVDSSGPRVLIHLMYSNSRFGNVFRYSAEGVHTFLGPAMRKGGES